MMLDWPDYRRQLGEGVKDLGKLSPDTLKGYAALSNAGRQADVLGAKTRELIALAIAAAVGRISWGWVIGALIGIAAIFGAPQIVAWIRTLFGV